MIDILDRIDSAIDGVCPCGANPRPGSAYCSYDCEPTHRSIHTTSDNDGTQMRWRPDLVTAHDDSNLELVCANIPRSQFSGVMYRRGATDTLHLRLDDGHRWVGCDVDGAGPGSVGRVLDAWTRLERELGNRRHLERPPFPGPASETFDWEQAQVNERRADLHAWRIADIMAARVVNPGSLIHITSA